MSQPAADAAISLANERVGAATAVTRRPESPRPVSSAASVDGADYRAYRVVNGYIAAVRLTTVASRRM